MFDISENPFVVLGTTPRSTKADVNEAFDDALLDAGDVESERRLNIARHALFTPNERIIAELGYLLELRPSEARKALSSKTFRQWIKVAESTHGVARANALVEAIRICRHVDMCRSLTVELLHCWSEIAPREIWRQINEARSISDFGSVPEGDIRRGLDKLCQAHAEISIESLDENSDLPTGFTSLLETDIISGNRTGEAFTSKLLVAYAQRESGELASAADRSLGYLQDFASSGSEQAFSNFEKAIKAWDSLAQPLQMVSQTKGADEPHSQELYQKVRSCALELANEESRHADAARITRVAESIFAELPSAKNQLREDSEILGAILERSEKTKILDSLAAAVATARDDLLRTSELLSTYHFAFSAPNPIGEIRRCFESLLTSDVPVELRDVGAQLLRSLAVELFNKRQDILNSISIIKFLISNRDWFSQEIYNKISDDNHILSKNLATYKLNTRKYNNINTNINSSNKIYTRIILAIIAAIIIIPILFNESNSNYNSRTNFADVPGDGADIAEDMDSSPPGDGSENQQVEIAPAFAGGVLSLPQLRYCVRQSERLDAARAMVDSYQQQSNFNAAIDDFNSRCSSFRYKSRDMATVRSEIDRMKDQLNEDAAEIVGPDDTSPGYRQPAYPGVGIDDDNTSDDYNIDSASNAASAVADAAKRAAAAAPNSQEEADDY